MSRKVLVFSVNPTNRFCRYSNREAKIDMNNFPRNTNDETFTLVANTVPVMIWITDVNGLCTYVNQRWLDFTGRPFESQLGNGWSEGIHPEDFASSWHNYTTACDRREPFKLEYRYRRWDGRYRWVQDSGEPKFDAEGVFVGYIGAVSDITELKLAEADLSDMSQRLLNAHEEERAWIARELHDDIGQRLSLLIMNLTRLSDRTSLTEMQDGIRKAIQQASDVGTEMRALSHRLHSPNWDYIGLDFAAAAHCKELNEQHDVRISVHSENLPTDLSPEVSLCLFRILQEALQNAIKHSLASYVGVTLHGLKDGIALVVHDTGTGFAVDEGFKRRGIGLSSMKERIKSVNGKIFIESEFGHGTTIRAWVPVIQLPTQANECVQTQRQRA
jgi:PAS domain S-box-containing protein